MLRLSNRDGAIYLPQGVDCPPMAVALSASEKLSARICRTRCECSGISGIYCGNICDGFRNAIQKLTSDTTVEVDYAKSAIVGGSNETDFSNLTASLNSIMELRSWYSRERFHYFVG